MSPPSHTAALRRTCSAPAGGNLPEASRETAAQGDSLVSAADDGSHAVATARLKQAIRQTPHPASGWRGLAPETQRSIADSFSLSSRDRFQLAVADPKSFPAIKDHLRVDRLLEAVRRQPSGEQLIAALAEGRTLPEQCRPGLVNGLLDQLSDCYYSPDTPLQVCLTEFRETILAFKNPEHRASATAALARSFANPNLSGEVGDMAQQQPAAFIGLTAFHQAFAADVAALPAALQGAPTSCMPNLLCLLPQAARVAAWQSMQNESEAVGPHRPQMLSNLAEAAKLYLQDRDRLAASESLLRQVRALAPAAQPVVLPALMRLGAELAAADDGNEAPLVAAFSLARLLPEALRCAMLPGMLESVGYLPEAIRAAVFHDMMQMLGRAQNLQAIDFLAVARSGDHDLTQRQRNTLVQALLIKIPRLDERLRTPVIEAVLDLLRLIPHGDRALAAFIELQRLLPHCASQDRPGCLIRLIEGIRLLPEGMPRNAAFNAMLLETTQAPATTKLACFTALLFALEHLPTAFDAHRAAFEWINRLQVGLTHPEQEIMLMREINFMSLPRRVASADRMHCLNLTIATAQRLPEIHRQVFYRALTQNVAVTERNLRDRVALTYLHPGTLPLADALVAMANSRAPLAIRIDAGQALLLAALFGAQRQSPDAAALHEKFSNGCTAALQEEVRRRVAEHEAEPQPDVHSAVQSNVQSDPIPLE